MREESFELLVTPLKILPARATLLRHNLLACDSCYDLKGRTLIALVAAIIIRCPVAVLPVKATCHNDRFRFCEHLKKPGFFNPVSRTT